MGREIEKSLSFALEVNHFIDRTKLEKLKE